MIVLFFYLLSSSLCVITANVIRFLSLSHPTKIIDIVHHYIPLVKETYISDILVLTQLVATIILMDSNTLLEMLLIMAIAQLCRVVCMISTVLPPLKNYQDKYRLCGVNGSGTEYIFSGHACYATVSAIYLYSQGIVNLPFLVVYNLISQFLITATRNHYTVDIVLAWIIVPLIYGNVKLCLQLSECRQKLKFMF